MILEYFQQEKKLQEWEKLAISAFFFFFFFNNFFNF